VTISFGGQTWLVDSYTGNPGPTNFDARNVFLDGAGNLHLDVAQQNGQWSGAQLETTSSLGFGTYRVRLATPMYSIDKNIVVGLFGYGAPTWGPDGTNELDTEFATWGGYQTETLNWTVWPAKTGYPKGEAILPQPVDGGDDTYVMTWTSTSVSFQAITGDGSKSPYQSWTYTPADSQNLIPQHAQPFSLIAWLFGAQAPSDGKALDVVVSGFSYTPLGAVAISDLAGTYGSAAHATQTAAVNDSAANVAAGLDLLQGYAAVGKLSTVTLTDGGIPTLTITSAQLAADQAALANITGNYQLSITAPAASATIAGQAGHAIVLNFSDAAAGYIATPSGDGSSFTLSNGTATYHLSGITALKFTDYTVFVASQTPAAAGGVSSAQVADLYAAVFARHPDSAGLAYYQAMAAANPALPITVYAQDFLSSPEYAANTAHAYPQTSLGDAQFVTDTYANLLHRPPQPGDVAWYQASVIAPYLKGAVAGTAAYAMAELAAHAAVLADFSQSAEFTANVAITPAHPADAQHWLILI